MTGNNYQEFNSAVTELTNKVTGLISDVVAVQTVANIQTALDKAATATTKAAEASTSATNAAGSASTATTEATSATNSATSAATSATTATTKAAEASTSATNAASSAATATTKAAEASTSATSAASSAATATTKAAEASTSATNAAGSASAAATSKTGADTAKTAAETAKTAAESAKTQAETAQTASEGARDRAETAAATVTGNLVELGSVNLSGGVYPAKPANNGGFWKVVAGGIVSGTEYGVGDTLVYSKNLDQFYKIDNTESVTSVAGKQGIVTLVKDDVGLSQVDNTSDANKPVSTAQASALSGKQASNDNLTALSGLTGVADRLPYFTGAGALSLAVLTAAARTFLAASTVEAQLTALEFTPTGKALAKAADEAAGRTALGLGTAAVASMTTSQTDTTPGRVLRVGDFGAGTLIFLTSVDIDTLGVWNSSYYVSSGINMPTNDDGWLTHLGLLPDFTHQTFYASSGDRVYIRRKFNGLWRPWREIYHQGSILGTVSQSGGVPTGAIIERGSNANGEYVRYADGTQICWYTAVVDSTTHPGTSFNVPGAPNPPASFIGAFTSHYSGALFTGLAGSGDALYSLAITGGFARYLYNNGTKPNSEHYNYKVGTFVALSAAFHLMWIGRWF